MSWAAPLVAAVACSTGVVASASMATASIAHPQVVSEQPAAHTPHVAAGAGVAEPEVFAVAQSGDTMAAGGKFKKVESADRGKTYLRTHLFTFSATSGEVSNVAPALDGVVHALATDGSSLYVGGRFRSVNGVGRPALVKLDVNTGVVDAGFQPPIDRGQVTELRLVNGRLLVAGTFPRRLIALNPRTGRNTGYIDVSITGKVADSSGSTKVSKFAVNPAGTRLVAVGNFTTVDGAARQRAMMLELGDSSASVSPWYYQPLAKRCASNSATKQAYLTDVDFSPDGSYFVLVSTGYVPYHSSEIGETVCDATARFETDIDNPYRPTWINYTGGDTIHSVAATGAAVYVQGHFRWLDNPLGRDSAGPGAVVRRGIGAIDPAAGEALDWAPPKPARRGGLDLLATSQGLWVPSDSLRFDGEYHRGLAFCPL